MKKVVFVISLAVLFFSCNGMPDFDVVSEVPDLVMPDNHLKFKEIENYKNYKIAGTHFRTDKNELRYILTNEKAFKAYKDTNISFPDGSKIVKIGWDVEKMPNFSTALEAKDVQRIEYMIKDSKQFSDNPGNWGYARFVKEKGTYKSWGKGTASCIGCHNLAENNDYVFTRFQKLQ